MKVQSALFVYLFHNGVKNDCEEERTKGVSLLGPFLRGDTIPVLRYVEGRSLFVCPKVVAK